MVAIWTGLVTRLTEMKNLHSILVGKLEDMRPAGRIRCSWEDNIKLDLTEIRYEIVD
jgi:hypothetical protein